MFTAKPKLNNRLDTKEFECVKEAVTYLNKYNRLGKYMEFTEESSDTYAPELKAEDWWLLGKLTGPQGVEFKDNKVVEVK